MSEILVNIITFILYLIALVLIVIFVLAIINYALYTVYSIKEIVVHNTLDDAMFYKLKDIYNYRLVNYVNIINTNTNNHNIFENICSSEIRTIDMKKFTLIYNEGATNDEAIDLTYLKDNKTVIQKITDRKIEFELKNIDSIKDKDFDKIYKNIKYSSDIEYIEIQSIKYNNNIYKIKYKNEKIGYVPEININKSIYDIILYDTQLYDTQPITDASVIGKKLIGKNGIIYTFNIKDKYLNDYDKKSDIYGYILNGLYILFPTTLLWSYDNHVTALYVKTNNNLYEIILLLLFIIILIILLAFISDFYNFIFGIGNNESLFINKILDKNTYYLILIIFVLLAYCILHSIIYFFIFINGTYKRIKTIYDDLIIADEYIRSEVNNNLILNNNNAESILDTFIKIAYGDDINYMIGKYNVIDETNSENIDETIRKFEEKMLAINYSFNFDKEIYSQNNYTNAFFNSIYNTIIYTIGEPVIAEIEKITVNSTGGITSIDLNSMAKGKYYKNEPPLITIMSPTDTTGEQAKAVAKLKKSTITNTFLYEIDTIDITEEGKKYVVADSNKIRIETIADYKLRTNSNKTLLNIIIIYVYFVRNNVDDPYILIKLNKLIFGRVANVGIKKIDDEIDFTLSLKSLLGHNLQKEEIKNDLNDISTKLFAYINDKDKSGFKENIINLHKNNGKFITDFTDKLYIVRLDYWGAVYFFNLYLAVEIMLNAVIILIILLIIKYTDNDMRQKVVYYITVITAFIVFLIEEVQTAILGVI